MIQFWQVSLDEAMAGSDSIVRNALVPFLTMMFLVINILKELGQMATEGKKYFLNSEGKSYLPNFENISDLIIYVLVIICQYFYWCTGRVVNGYYIPENGTFSDDALFETDPGSESVFENFFLPTILLLHFNLIVQHMVAFKITRQYIVMII